MNHHALASSHLLQDLAACCGVSPLLICSKIWLPAVGCLLLGLLLPCCCVFICSITAAAGPCACSPAGWLLEPCCPGSLAVLYQCTLSTWTVWALCWNSAALALWLSSTSVLFQHGQSGAFAGTLLPWLSGCPLSVHSFNMDSLGPLLELCCPGSLAVLFQCTLSTWTVWGLCWNSAALALWLSSFSALFQHEQSGAFAGTLLPLLSGCPLPVYSFNMDSLGPLLELCCPGSLAVLFQCTLSTWTVWGLCWNSAALALWLSSFSALFQHEQSGAFAGTLLPWLSGCPLSVHSFNMDSLGPLLELCCPGSLAVLFQCTLSSWTVWGLCWNSAALALWLSSFSALFQHGLSGAFAGTLLPWLSGCPLSVHSFNMDSLGPLPLITLYSIITLSLTISTVAGVPRPVSTCPLCNHDSALCLHCYACICNLAVSIYIMYRFIMTVLCSEKELLYDVSSHVLADFEYLTHCHVCQQLNSTIC
ncbi:uncharacterized protein LOC115088723 isoform X1 [Rhinatrema bivittatum]|uniref:uncharacterized protein LOC115088723 isoform X1 n=1 Tax=Rhinatrema bivittatum TaxID=194408 RepID=UPI0011280442|nr:uncharacterized protein LOC115088723 isoform X1 [Rhinatrema bivittatum]